MQLRRFVWPAFAALAGMIFLPLTAQSQEIPQRRAHQHARIHQGVASGELTPREARRLRTREARIHTRAMRNRRRHGGHLTSAERRRLNRSLNRTSHAIYRKKHNGSVR